MSVISVGGLLPALHARGSFEVAAPWTIDSSLVYECIAIRSFEDFVDRGQDVVEKVYRKVGLSEVEAVADKAINAKIVTLRCDNRPMIFIPTTYITKAPVPAAAEYVRVVLSIDMGPLPITEPLDDLQTSLQEVVQRSFGFVPTVELHAAPHRGFITDQQHEQYLAVRQAAVANVQTDHEKVLALQTVADSQLQRIQLLERVLVDNNLLS